MHAHAHAHMHTTNAHLPTCPPHSTQASTSAVDYSHLPVNYHPMQCHLIHSFLTPSFFHIYIYIFFYLFCIKLSKQADMDRILSDAHLRPAMIRGTDTPKSQTWLDKLHNDVANVIAPRTPTLATPKGEHPTDATETPTSEHHTEVSETLPPRTA
jgi:hypothetical protein